MAGPIGALVPKLRGLKVVVLGLPVLDRYLYGVTHRVSREAPVLIVREESQALALGGAGNTAANLAGLDTECRLVGPIGTDPEGDAIARLSRELGIREAGLVRSATAVTVTKTRILAGGLHTTRQQMLRIDREQDDPPSEQVAAKLIEAGRAALEGADAVIVSDYGSGALTELWQGLAYTARSLGLPVVVDSRHGLLRFFGVTALTPNEPEAEAALGRPIRTRAEAERAALELRDRLSLEALLLTRGREGMVIAPRDGPLVALSAIGGEAVDVTGAGDTVAATFTAALGAGADVVTAARLSNLAASVVVQRIGTAPIDAPSLAEAAEGLEAAP